MKTQHRHLSTILTSVSVLILLAVSVATIGTSIAQSATKEIPNNPPAPADPVMTEELMGRLIKYTRNIQGTSTVPARICKILNICDGTKDMPLKLTKSDSTDGLHVFGVPVELDSKDILILVKRDTIMEAYLTDKTGKLRAAAISENLTARLITNEKAAEKFKSELGLFAKEAAAQLPPSGTTDGGKK